MSETKYELFFSRAALWRKRDWSIWVLPKALPSSRYILTGGSPGDTPRRWKGRRERKRWWPKAASRSNGKPSHRRLSLHWMIQFLDQSNYASLLFSRLILEGNHLNMANIVTCDKSWHDEDQVGDEVKSHHCYCGTQNLPSFLVVVFPGAVFLFIIFIPILWCLWDVDPI